MSISKSIYLQEDRIKSAFRIFDIKDKGKINWNDLKSVFGKHKYYEAKPDSYWEKMLTKTDFNKDGLIDINDFMEMMKSD